MLGAIVGDVVGSVYEWNNIKTNAAFSNEVVSLIVRAEK